DAEDCEVNDDERRERCADRGRGERRYGVDRAEHAVDYERLAPSLLRDPAGDDGDEAGGSHREREAMQPAPNVERLAPARGQADEAEASHQHAKAPHKADAHTT